MCNKYRNPIQCILPPYLFDKVLKDEKNKLFEEALDNKFRNSRLRNDRKFISALPQSQMRMLQLTTTKVSAKPKPNIKVHSCKHGYSLPGTLITDPSKDKDAKNVQKGAEETWKFFYDLFKRNSIDNQGMAIIQSVHYGKRYQNAMWNGRQMLYGDGDGKVFGSFTLDIDIIGHELAHGVTQFEANLDYENQSGALNESFSDVFGIMVKQRALNQDVKKSNWLIGENVMLGSKYALRSMKAPGTAFLNHPEWGDDPQPATMDGYVKLPNTEAGDNGGVHYNSGIPNFAFYVACFNRGGFSWETIGKIWYAALTDTVTLRPNANFADVKKLTIKKATELFGKGSLEEKAVKQGWKEAKV